MTSPMVSRPDTVAFSELALLAGLCGRSMTLHFSGWPVSLLAAWWRHVALALPRTGVLHVESRRDLRRLRDNLPAVRLVTVCTARLRSEVAWTIATATSAGPRPAVFTCGDGIEPDEGPGVTLVLRANEVEVTALTEWIGQPNGIAPVATSSAASNVPSEFPAVLRQRLGWHDAEVVMALMSGAHVRRTGTTETAIDVEDYLAARELLQSNLVTGGENVAAPAAAMVGRANVYITVRYGRHDVLDHPLRKLPRPPALRGNRPVPVTRREIADLGNTRSSLVGSLLEYVLSVENGLDEYVRMGLVGRPAASRDWPPGSIEPLRQGLLGWSPKQVRTQFDRLVRQGLITAERTAANGPWEYVLPEELAQSANPFRDLPPRPPCSPAPSGDVPD